MSAITVLINGHRAGEGTIAVRENHLIVIRVEPEGPIPLASLGLHIAGVRQPEGSISPSKPDGVEWRFTPSSVAGLLPLGVSGPGLDWRGHISVEPAKLTVEEYEFLLADLRRVAYGIMYAMYAPTHRGLQRQPPSPDPLQRLLERFRFLEELAVVKHVLHLVRMLPYHHVIQAETALVQRDRVRRISLAALHGIARRPESRHVPSVIKQISPDSYENRVVKLLLLSLRRLAATLAREAEQWASPRADGRSLSPPLMQQLQHIQSSGFRWVRELDQQLGQEPWPAVGAAAAPDRLSTVFVIQPGYRELLQWYRRLQDTWEATLDSPAFTLPLRDLPDLYEIWCFARVVAALQRGLGHPGYDQGLIRIREGGFEFSLERGGASGIAFRTGDHRVVVRYNKMYRGFTDLVYYPDISLEIMGPGGAEGLIVLDAKYRLNGEDNSLSYKQDDIDKMHTYRDAIRWTGTRVESAFILYPGDEAAVWGGGAIGAVPLRPSPELVDTDLDRTLALCLNRFGIEWKERA